MKTFQYMACSKPPISSGKLIVQVWIKVLVLGDEYFFSSSPSLYIGREKLPLTFLNQNPVIFWGDTKQNCVWQPLN